MVSRVLEQRIRDHEGFSDVLCQDNLGFATIGYGHLITDKDDFKPGVKYPENQLLELFRIDLNRAEEEANDIVGHIQELHVVARDCIIEMCYQLGKSGVRKFSKMLLSLEEKDYKTASIEMLDSRWRKQTKTRCEYLAKLMKECA